MLHVRYSKLIPFPLLVAGIEEIRVTRAGCSEESAAWPGRQESSSGTLDRTGPQHYYQL